MSLVEQDLVPREVGRPNSNSQAAGRSYIDRIPSTGTGREHLFTNTRNRTSYDSMQSDFYASMDAQEMISAKAAQRVPEEQAPVLPQKSALRASRLLDNLVGLKLAVPADTPAFAQTPHDEYLSSEEEASSTAGDFSDFEYGSSSEDTSPLPTKDQSSREDTARVVSVIFSGKPSVVDVTQNRRSISPISLERRQSIFDSASVASVASKPPIQVEVKAKRTSRRTSTSTTSSDSNTPKPQVIHPPRSSSMQPSNTLKKDKPFFLQIDPYANGSVYSLDSNQEQNHQKPAPHEPKVAEEEERPKTPKTPTRMFKGVARTLSLMKRRSMPKMNQAFLSPSNEQMPFPISPDKRSIAEETLSEVSKQDTKTETTTTTTTTTTTPVEATTAAAAAAAAAPSPTPTPPPPARPLPPPLQAPVTYDDIIRTAKRNERNDKLLSVTRSNTFDVLETPKTPISPLSISSTGAISTTGNGKRISTLSAARRRMSVKLTGRFQL